MATPEVNENCHHVQNDSHRCKIKLENFILIPCGVNGVIKEILGGGAEFAPPQVR